MSDTQEEEQQPPIVVPIDKINKETLMALIHEFILREGTDYGHQMPALEEKVSKVSRQIDNKQAFIVFDPNTESCTLLRKEELKKRGVEYGF